jgi:hypothetical protein
MCGNPYLLLRERKGGDVLVCDKGGCGFEKPSGKLPEMKEIFLSTPPKARASSSRKPAPRRRAG